MNEKRQLAIKLLSSRDHAALREFMGRCKSLGYLNNSSAQALKLSSPSLQPVFWIAVDQTTGKIAALSGLHAMKEGKEARIAYRSCYISPGFNLFSSEFGKTWWKHSLIFNCILPLQVDYLLDRNIGSMYMTSNVDSTDTEGGKKPQKVNDLMLPALARTGVISLERERVNYFNCLQNFWKLNISEFKEMVQNNLRHQKPDVEFVYI